MTENGDDARSEGNQPNLLPLQPFSHQVGGHSCLMLYNKSTICKPLAAKEYEFYLQMPECLKIFTPEYKGVTEVILEKDSSGCLHCYALPNLCYSSWEALERKKNEISSHALEDQHHNCGDSLCSGQRWVKVSQKLTGTHNCGACSKLRVPPDVSNPWTKEVLWRLWNRIPCEKRVMETFILLENVVVKFKAPCILDLKMGIRQHGEDASAEKIDRRLKRVAVSTSGTLGTRLCGMKIYNPEEESYTFVDKYEGRVMDRDGLERCLRQFFNKNTRLRKDLVRNCITKLVALSACLKDLNDYRFYSSSLLLLYDACAKDANVDIRIIDFANVSQTRSSSDVGTYDEGFIFGLKNLVCLLEELHDQFIAESSG